MGNGELVGKEGQGEAGSQVPRLEAGREKEQKARVGIFQGSKCSLRNPEQASSRLDGILF